MIMNHHGNTYQENLHLVRKGFSKEVSTRVILNGWINKNQIGGGVCI